MSENTSEMFENFEMITIDVDSSPFAWNSSLCAL